MRLTLATLGVLALITVPCARASAQAPPGKRLTLDVEIAAAAMRGDTTRVTYLLSNRPTSTEQLFQFSVDAPSPVIWIPTPAPDADWTTGVKFAGRSIARWAVLGEQMAPGDTSPPLSFEAVGLAALVDVWVRGYVPPEPPPTALPDSVIDTMPPRPVPNILDLSLKSTTVGVAPLPSGMTNEGLIVRLDSLTTRTCTDLAWIGSSTACSNLDGHLSTASAALGASDNAGARTALQGYVAELDGTHFPPTGSPTVNGSAYWLLRPNATFILGRIPPP